MSCCCRLLCLVLVLFPSTLLAWSPGTTGVPVLPAEEAYKQWGDTPAAALVRGFEYVRAGKPLMMMDYPGRREVYNNVPIGDYDLTRVDTEVHVDLDLDGPLAVTAQYTIVPLVDDLEELVFYLELPELEQVTMEPALDFAWERAANAVIITFASPPPFEEELVLDFAYHGKMNCDVKFMLPTCKLEGAWKYVTHSQFLPQDDKFNEVFVGTMKLRVSGDGFEKWHAGGTGTYTGTKLPADEGCKVISFEHVFPTSLYAWSLSQMTTVHSMAGDIPISATVPHSQVKNMGTILGIVQDVVEFYNSIYVHYPWNNLDTVAMPKSFGGGFGPLSTIFVVKGILDATPDNNSIYSAMQLLSHEIGHEWWGNHVEMADGSAVVLSEGLAEFSSNLFFQHATGSRWAFVDNNMSFTYTVPHDEEPLMVSPYVYTSPYYYQVAYQKGAAVFDMLRLEIGDELLLAALKEMGERYDKQYAYPGDLLEVLEEVSGVDLDYFYERWLEGRGSIIADVGGSCPEGGSSCVITVTQDPEKVEGLFQFSLPVLVRKHDGSSEEHLVKVKDWEEEVELPVAPDTVQRIYLDPFRQLARIWRPALPGDIDLSGTVDGSDLVELSYAYQLNLLVVAEWGDYFYANAQYNELADLVDEVDGPGQIDGRINASDLEYFLEQIGKTSK